MIVLDDVKIGLDIFPFLSHYSYPDHDY